MAVQSPQEAAAFMKELVLLLGESSQTEAGRSGALPLKGRKYRWMCSLQMEISSRQQEIAQDRLRQQVIP